MIETKTCSNCKVEKLLTEFNKKTGRVLQPWCKICSREESRRHYNKNKDSYLIKQRKRNKEKRDEINNYISSLKGSTPCKDCTNIYPHYVMDFDHLTEKEFNVSQYSRLGYNLEEVKLEIDKCEIVCSNCHRERTYKRRAGLV